ncbi:MAG: carbamoyltransferase HypF [Acidobacteriota bacterium]|nr:carbamoyltransferase HypF [Acidobacteriota bacterium]
MARPERLRLEIGGAVQGVGFRPFVYRLAREMELAGWVINDGGGVRIEVEGERSRLEAFHSRLETERPPRALVMSVKSEWCEPEGFVEFSIRRSDERGQLTVVVLPDVATCSDCLAEVSDSMDRRHRYPFTNCTNCGPRFSIIESLPYDRPNTTMRLFAMCDRCRHEYEEPLNRRFHAQPNACPDCGPRLDLWNRDGHILASGDAAARAAVERLRKGHIVALKGLGGFILLVAADDERAVVELRRRKGRDEKPLALMVADLDAARMLCVVPQPAASALLGPESPIVLLDRRIDAAVAAGVAPANPRLGIMLPYTPLHHLLLRDLGQPLVATSGNLSDEPICIDNQEALERLGGVADCFLVHDRRIERHIDDSVVQFVGSEVQPLRRARGYAPLPVRMGRELPTVLAVGGHLKNTAALGLGENVFVSQHIGDLETPQARAAFERVIADFLELYQAEPVCLARDLHPEYFSSRWVEDRCAERREEGTGALQVLAGLPAIAVQHHHAHLAACLAEHQSTRRALGVIWDGTGFGTDGTVWGGEFLVGDALSFDRIAALRPFRLLGGDAAVKEPRRVALAIAHTLWGREGIERGDLAFRRSFKPAELAPLAQMVVGGFRSPLTTSGGRLFDGVASLLDLHQRVTFEGQAAMALEHVADIEHRDAYPLPLIEWPVNELEGADVPRIALDWAPLVEALVEDSRRGRQVGMIAARFHNAVAEGIVNVARVAGEGCVVLSGGCFQNRLLSVRTSQLLQADGFEVLQHRLLPANDGGLSAGQVAVAAARLDELRS